LSEHVRQFTTNQDAITTLFIVSSGLVLEADFRSLPQASLSISLIANLLGHFTSNRLKPTQ
jgi:hypothetical protein